MSVSPPGEEPILIANLHSWSLTEGNLVFESEHTSGGHFAAHEKPQELVDDLRKMFGKDGPAFGVVREGLGTCDACRTA